MGLHHRRYGPWPAVCLLCVAFFVDVMGATSVFTAAPSLKRALGLTPVGLQWSITAATLPGGALLLVGGRLADLLGRRRLFMAGVALLVIASLICGLSPSPSVLIGGRILQGVAGALLIPAALALVIGLFVDEADRNRALAAWSAIGGIGATAGLVFGGLVTVGLGWQWVFLINVPVGLLMLCLSPLLLDEPVQPAASRKLDRTGIVTFTGGLGLFIYGISQVPDLGWASWRTLGCAAAGLVLLVAFVSIEWHTPTPVLPPWLLRSRRLLAGNATLFVAGICVDGLLFTLTLYTQRVQGYSALEFGGLTAVMTLCSTGAAALAQRAVARVGTAIVASVGVALLAVTCGLFAFATSLRTPLPVLIVGMVAFGLGMGCAFVAGSVASLQDVHDEDAGVAAAVQNIAFSAGTTVGVAVLSTIATEATARLTPRGHASLLALTSGYRAAFIGGALIAAFGLPAAASMRSRPRRRRRLQEMAGGAAR
jgi:EmrB/QacA subfamily drug resistance transporter